MGHPVPLLTFLSSVSKYEWMDSISMTFLYLFIEKQLLIAVEYLVFHGHFLQFSK